MSAAESSIGVGVISRPGLDASGTGTTGERIGRHRSGMRAVLTWHRMFYRPRHYR